eukprot:5789107-Amphidinium_carterae.2
MTVMSVFSTLEDARQWQCRMYWVHVWVAVCSTSYLFAFMRMQDKVSVSEGAQCVLRSLSASWLTMFALQMLLSC